MSLEFIPPDPTLSEAIDQLTKKNERIAELERQLAEKDAEIERLKAALTRLGRMEALEDSRLIEYPRDKELIARIEYAREHLSTLPEEKKDND